MCHMQVEVVGGNLIHHQFAVVLGCTWCFVCRVPCNHVTSALPLFGNKNLFFFCLACMLEQYGNQSHANREPMCKQNFTIANSEGDYRDQIVRLKTQAALILLLTSFSHSIAVFSFVIENTVKIKPICFKLALLALPGGKNVFQEFRCKGFPFSSI